MAKKTIKPRPVMLQEVKVTATPLKKMKVQEETVRLYPKGEVSKRKLDSAVTSNPSLKKYIGNPIRKKGEKPLYGVSASDVIKKSIKGYKNK